METDLSVASIVQTPDDGTNVTLTTQTSGGSSGTSLTNKHTLSQGTGITITNSGVGFDGGFNFRTDNIN